MRKAPQCVDSYDHESALAWIGDRALEMYVGIHAHRYRLTAHEMHKVHAKLLTNQSLGQGSWSMARRREAIVGFYVEHRGADLEQLLFDMIADADPRLLGEINFEIECK